MGNIHITSFYSQLTTWPNKLECYTKLGSKACLGWLIHLETSLFSLCSVFLCMFVRLWVRRLTFYWRHNLTGQTQRHLVRRRFAEQRPDERNRKTSFHCETFRRLTNKTFSGRRCRRRRRRKCRRRSAATDSTSVDSASTTWRRWRRPWRGPDLLPGVVPVLRQFRLMTETTQPQF